MDLLLKIVVAFLFAYVFFLIWSLIRGNVAFRNHSKILDAAFLYSCVTGQPEKFSVIANAMEPYEQTVLRWNDFGYKNILPKEYFELIKPYIR